MSPINYSALSDSELVALHNALAPERDVSAMRWNRCELVERIAILRTLKPKRPPAPSRVVHLATRKQPVRDAILKEIGLITHYEHAVSGDLIAVADASKYQTRLLISVGLPYAEVLARVRKQFPETRLSVADLRWSANQVRSMAAGFEGCSLPEKRARA